MSEVEQVLKGLVARFRPEAAGGLRATYQLQLSGNGGGAWHIAIADGKCALQKGAAEKPQVTIAMSEDDFRALIEGRLNAMSAYSEGRVRIGGDLFLAMRLGELFGF